MTYQIAVIDGMGGGLGKAICERISKYSNNTIKIIALGTNSFATSNMLKHGATEGATGENAICHMSNNVDLIIGPLAILVANSMMGEISSQIAGQIAQSKAHKIILPLQKCNISVVGTDSLSIKDMLDQVEKKIKERIPNN